MKWFRDQRSDRAKRAKRSIKNFYTLPSGQPKFKSLEEINTELEIFRSEDPRDKEKAAERLGAIGQSIRKGAYNPTEAERFWLRSLVGYLVNCCILWS